MGTKAPPPTLGGGQSTPRSDGAAARAGKRRRNEGPSGAEALLLAGLALKAPSPHSPAPADGARGASSRPRPATHLPSAGAALPSRAEPGPGRGAPAAAQVVAAKEPASAESPTGHLWSPLPVHLAAAAVGAPVQAGARVLALWREALTRRAVAESSRKPGVEAGAPAAEGPLTQSPVAESSPARDAPAGAGPALSGDRVLSSAAAPLAESSAEVKEKAAAAPLPGEPPLEPSSPRPPLVAIPTPALPVTPAPSLSPAMDPHNSRPAEASPLLAARASALASPLQQGWNALLQQLQGRVEQLRAEGGGQARLSLRPEELGQVELALERTTTGWRLEIRAEVTETARQFQNQAQDLHDRLSAAGLRLEELRLQVPLSAPPLQADGLAAAPGQAEGTDSGGRAPGDGEPRDEDPAEEPGGERKSSSSGGGEEFAKRLESLLHRWSQGEAS